MRLVLSRLNTSYFGKNGTQKQCLVRKIKCDAFISFSTRVTVLAAICLTQAFMMWKFINFQLRRWREHAQAQTLKKKQAPSKSKSKKDKGESTSMNWLPICKNMAGGSSPRIN